MYLQRVLRNQTLRSDRDQCFICNPVLSSLRNLVIPPRHYHSHPAALACTASAVVLGYHLAPSHASQHTYLWADLLCHWYGKHDGRAPVLDSRRRPLCLRFDRGQASKQTI